MKKRQSKHSVDLDLLPEDLAWAIICTLRERPAQDTLLWYGRWQSGMTLQDLADRWDVTLEAIRLRLEKLNREIKEKYEQQVGEDYNIVPMEENPVYLVSKDG